MDEVKFVTLDQILKKDSSLGSWINREIAMTIITPEQTLHVVPVGSKFDLHFLLLQGALEYIYPNSTVNTLKGYNPLAIHYVLDSNNAFEVNSANIHTPGYLTQDQAERLRDIVNILDANGFKIGIIMGIVDPATLQPNTALEFIYLDPEDIVAEDKGEFIYSLFHDNGRIKPYTLPFGDETIVEVSENLER